MGRKREKNFTIKLSSNIVNRIKMIPRDASLHWADIFSSPIALIQSFRRPNQIVQLNPADSGSFYKLHSTPSPRRLLRTAVEGPALNFVIKFALNFSVPLSCTACRLRLLG